MSEPHIEAPHGYIDDPLDGQPCPACDDTGEVWTDVEMNDGRVREVMRVCGCGGAA